MSIWNILTLAVIALLVFDTDLRAHLWGKIHNTLHAITTALHTIWAHLTNRPPPPPPLSTPPVPPPAS